MGWLASAILTGGVVAPVGLYHFNHKENAKEEVFNHNDGRR